MIDVLSISKKTAGESTRFLVSLNSVSHGHFRLCYEYDGKVLALLESVNNVAALSLFMDPNNYNLDFSQADEVIPGIETVHRMCLDICRA